MGALVSYMNPEQHPPVVSGYVSASSLPGSRKEIFDRYDAGLSLAPESMPGGCHCGKSKYQY